jgi:type IV secretion system protein VirB10
VNNVNEVTGPEGLEGERSIPSVNNSSGRTSAKRGVMAIFILLVLAVAAYLVYRSYAADQSRRKAQSRDVMASTVPARSFELPPAPKPPVPEVKPPEPIALKGAAPALPNAGGPGDHEKKAATLDKSASALMPEGKGQGQSGKASSEPTVADRMAAVQGMAGLGGPNGGFAQEASADSIKSRLDAVSTPKKPAQMLGNRNMTLAKGVFIDCVLQTKLDTTVPGMTSCIVSRNIYSDNGKVLLIERGSLATGEYQSNMRQGMARIFVLWNRIKTPNGVTIALDSPGADPLGGSGLPGYIDTHFWERFGGALMLSLVDDMAAAATRNNGGGNNFNNTSQGAQNAASEALKNTINIPPTLYKNQGERVGIFVARDLDFSSVYDVSASE